jgi:hypothetical protein
MESLGFGQWRTSGLMVDVPLRHRNNPARPPAADRELAERALQQAASWRHAAALLVAGVLLVVALGALIQAALSLYRDHQMLTGLTSERTPVHLTIGAEALVIPANMLRSARARTGGAVGHADLVFHWPDLEGYSDRLADAFADGAPTAPIVYATIAPRDTPLDATARLDTVYARFFVDKPVPGPAGLVGRRLSADSGYEGEVVFFVPAAPQPFVARCLATATAEVPATCLRDINFGGNLSLLFRFNRDLLPDWRQLDAGMRRLAAGFVAR